MALENTVKKKKKRKKKKNTLLNWIFLVILVAGVGAISWYSYNQTQKETKWKLADYQGTESTYMGDLQLSILAAATLQPFEVVQVRPEASGKIEELYIEIGDWVEEGQPMALLDQEDLYNQLEAARVDLSRSQANYDLVSRGYTPRELQGYEAQIDSAQLALNEAREDLNYVKELHESGFASDEELDTAEYTVEQAELNLRQAQDALDVLLDGSTSEEIRSASASVQISRLNVQNAENSLGDATIFCPMSGVVLERFVTEGSVIVSSLASFSGGDPVCSIGDLSSMKAYAYVDENDIGMVEIGQVCELDVDAYRGEIFEGLVLKIHPQAVSQGGVTVFTVEVEVPNDEERLMAGMSCEVEIITEKFDEVLLVPDPAVVMRDDRHWVFVVDEDDRIEAREIEVGETNYEYTEVISGLEEDEQVIVRGVPRDLLDEVLEDEESNGGGGLRIEVN